MEIRKVAHTVFRNLCFKNSQVYWDEMVPPTSPDELKIIKAVSLFVISKKVDALSQLSCLLRCAMLYGIVFWVHRFHSRGVWKKDYALFL